MHRERILIADDDENFRDVMKLLVENMGYVSDIAVDGMDCLSKFSHNPVYDVVLLDISMPNLDGIQTTKKLKEIYPDVTVIIISGSKDPELIRRTLKAGAFDYLFKPFELIEAESAIQSAIDRARLLRENSDFQDNLKNKVREQTQEIIGLYADTMKAMIQALDMREKESLYHSYRVTEYALSFAKKLNLSKSRLSILAKAALLHDIGKIGVPDSILLKPGELTDDEWNIMKKHPHFGYEFVKKIKFLEDSADIVLNHHERFDGKGYPNGYKAELIPYEARIFSIVDTLDALTSKRIYREPISFEEAKEYIKSSSSAKFDPELVNIYVNIPDQEWSDVRDIVDRSGNDYLHNLFNAYMF